MTTNRSSRRRAAAIVGVGALITTFTGSQLSAAPGDGVADAGESGTVTALDALPDGASDLPVEVTIDGEALICFCANILRATPALGEAYTVVGSTVPDSWFDGTGTGVADDVAAVLDALGARTPADVQNAIWDYTDQVGFDNGINDLVDNGTYTPVPTLFLENTSGSGGQNLICEDPSPSAATTTTTSTTSTTTTTTTTVAPTTSTTTTTTVAPTSTTSNPATTTPAPTTTEVGDSGGATTSTTTTIAPGTGTATTAPGDAGGSGAGVPAPGAEPAEPADQPTSRLPATGSSSWSLVISAMLLALIGSALLAAARPARPARPLRPAER